MQRLQLWHTQILLIEGVYVPHIISLDQKPFVNLTFYQKLG